MSDAMDHPLLLAGSAWTARLRVVKLGGSLMDLPDLPARFARYRAMWGDGPMLLVVGGGCSADVVRELDRLHQLGDHDGHWLAVRAMQFNAHCMARVLAGCAMASLPGDCPAIWQCGKVAVIDPLAWLDQEKRLGVALPQRWAFTSDSIAAHLAWRLGAAGLTLLKSTLPDTPCDAATAARLGVVDAHFPLIRPHLKEVELVNLRADPPARQLLDDHSTSLPDKG